jgi:hypothetical protein
MYHFSITLFVLFSASLLYQADAEALESPVSPAHQGLANYGQVQGRQLLLTGENYCFGVSSICSLSNNLYSDCEGFIGQEDLTQFYDCICGNGYMSTDQA